MKILIAEDDPVSRRVLEEILAEFGHDRVVAADGLQAWAALQQGDGPQLAIMDWMMPGMDGIQLCRKVRATPATAFTYLILVTSRGEKADVVAGLEAGANDYITKPFDRQELQARVRVGVRVVELQQSLADRVKELEEALAHVKQLQGILPICCYCKKIRNDDKFWERVEDYIGQHADVAFSHGICPECWDTVVGPQMEEAVGYRIPYEE
jgi:sigma-B regulation protein RsbU (phosphoserine phosphatase)